MKKEDRSPVFLKKGYKIPPWMIPWIMSDKLNEYKPEEEVKQENMKVRIKSVSENEFVIVYNGFLYGDGDSFKQKDEFRLVFVGDNRVKIRHINGQFVRLDDNERLVADSNKNKAEVFKLEKVNNKEYAMKATSNKKYVRVRDNDKRLVAKADNVCKRCLFKFKQV